jgi:hypothetical protein
MSKVFNAKQVIEDLQAKDTSVQLKSLSTLSTLTAVGNVPVEVLNAVVDLLKTTENKLVLNTVLVAIRHLSTFDRTKMMFGDSTSVQEALLTQVEKINSPNLQYGALEALVILTSGYEPNQIQLMTFASKLIIPVVGLIQREGERTRKLACKLLDQLVANDKCVELLCQETQRVVKRVDIEELKKEAERERQKLFDEGGEEGEELPPPEPEEEEFFEQNFLEPLVICLQVLDRSIQEWTTEFFLKIANHRNGFYCKYLAEVAIVEPLVSILFDATDSIPLMTNVLKLLNNLTDGHDQSRQWAGDHHCAQILCSIIRKHTPGLNKHVSIAYSQTPAVRQLTALAMRLLVNITQSKVDEDISNKLEVAKNATGINLQSGYIENQDPAKLTNVQLEVVKEGGLKVLYQYVRPIQYGGSGDDDFDKTSRQYTHQLQEHAVRVIANISRNEENAIRVLSMKAPPINEKLLREMKAQLEEERRREKGETKEELSQPEAASSPEMNGHTTPITPEGGSSKAPPPPVPEKPADRTLSSPNVDANTTSTDANMTSSPSEQRESTEAVAGHRSEEKTSPPSEEASSKAPPPPVPEKPANRTVSSPNVDANTTSTPETKTTVVIPPDEEYKGDAPSLVELLLDLLVEKRDNNNLKKNVIEAMANFTIHDECVIRLVQMGVIERLLELIKSKTEILVIADLFARMNEHSSFQKLFYQNKGLKPLIVLLKSRDDTEIEAGLCAVGPFVYTPNGRIILQREGVFKLVREHMKKGGLIGKMAKKIMKVLKQEGIQAMGGNSGAMVTTIVNGEEQTIFVEFDWDEAHRIDRELVAPAQKHLQELTTKPRFKLTVNWRSIERTPQHLGLLARETLWDELVLALEMLLGSDPQTIHTFNSQIQMLVVEVNNTDKTVAEIGDLVLRYKISPDGVLWTPKNLCKTLSEDLLGYDVTEFDDMLEENGFDEEYVQGIEALKRCALDSRIPMIGDLNLLYFHLETSDQLYKPTFIQSQVIVACKAVIDEDELLIKAWPIVKYNKKGFKQERLLMLTNLSYYTVAFDAKNRKIDYKHCKIHNLEDYYLIDVGPFVGHEKEGKDGSKRESSSKRDSSSGEQKEGQEEEVYAMNMVTNEKPHKGEKEKSNDEDETEDDDDLITSLDHDEKDDDDDLNSTLKEEQDLMNITKEETTANEEDKSIVRPSTKGKYCSIIVAPSDIKRNKQKQYLQEIAWCFYAAASAIRRGEVHQPFEHPVRKPKISFMSKIGNKFGAGVSGNFQKAGHSKILSKLQQEQNTGVPARTKSVAQSEEILKKRQSFREKLFGVKLGDSSPTESGINKQSSFSSKK